MTQITICPPAAARGAVLDQVQFANRKAYPVEAHFVGYGNGRYGWSSTGIDFDSYQRMSTHSKSVKKYGRRLDVPDYMQNEKRFRTIIIRYLEIRAGLIKRKEYQSETERTAAVFALLKVKAEKYERRVNEFCARYVAASTDAERAALQQPIAVFDSFIRMCREPSVIPSMCRSYYFEGLNSIEVGERVGFSGPCVRQILGRLRALDQKMYGGA
jgi:hypothetical protein